MKLVKKLTFRNLKLNKKRSVVTIVGIILSTALLVALCTLTGSLYSSLVESQKASSGNYHYLFEGFDEERIAELERNKSIETLFSLKQCGYANLEDSKNEYKPYGEVIATNEDGFENLSFNLIEGRLPKNGNEIVISRHLRTNGRIVLSVGESVTLSVGSRKILTLDEIFEENPSLTEEEREYVAQAYNDADYEYIAERKDVLNQYDSFKAVELDDGRIIPCEKTVETVSKTYTIVGIMERPGYGIEPYSAPGYTFLTYDDNSDSEDTTVYVRYTSKGLEDRFRVTSGILGVDEELFEEACGDDGFEASIQLSDELNEKDISYSENYYLVRYETFDLGDGSLMTIAMMSIVVVIIIIVTSVFCIKNSFSISVSEKVRQYGMLKSIGATGRQIKGSVLYEGVCLGIVGIPLGVASGIFAAAVLIRLTDYIMSDSLNVSLVLDVSPWPILLAVILAAVTIYLSAVGCAGKAKRVSPLSAIRGENEIKISEKKLKTPRYVSKLWGVGGVVSYKNLKRSRRKYRTSVVSIAICTITFIAITYFMKLAFSVMDMSYESEDYNVSCHFYSSEKSDYASFVSEIEALAGVREFNYVKVDFIEVRDDTVAVNEEYKKLINPDGGTGSVQISIICLTDDAFAEYEKKVGVKSSDAGKGAILVDNLKVEYYDEEKEETVLREIEQFKYESGDIMNAGVIDYEDEYWKSDDASYEGAPVEVKSIRLNKVTEVAPLGYGGSGSRWLSYLFVNEEMFNEIVGNSINGNEKMFITTDEPDDICENMEKILTEAGVEEEEYYIYNADESMKAVKSLYVMIGIFSYGFITVIALIGITSIINTISTGMELRSREFATLRSVGMTTKEFNRMIRLESLFVGAKAMCFALPVSVLICYLLHCILMNGTVVLRFRLPLMPMFVAVVVVMLLLLLIMKFSLNKIKKQNIIETIKNENI